jgi:hypothetical protein
MDVVAKSTLGNSAFFTVLAVVIALAVGSVVYMVISRQNTVPSGSKKEGFQGPANGVSSIPCGQESSHVTDILEMFANKMSTLEEGKPDLKEFKEIMSKLCCIKHDLMSASQRVDSTLYIPYNNTHDRENPADTVGRCFTKSLPIRDLDIIFGTWKERGLTLLSRLCTSFQLTSKETEKTKRHFMGLWSDVFDIAKTTCSPSETAPEYGSPRDPIGTTPEKVKGLGPYNGYY